jgi:hypothetical protein
LVGIVKIQQVNVAKRRIPSSDPLLPGQIAREKKLDASRAIAAVSRAKQAVEQLGDEMAPAAPVGVMVFDEALIESEVAHQMGVAHPGCGEKSAIEKDLGQRLELVAQEIRGYLTGLVLLIARIDAVPMRIQAGK